MSASVDKLDSRADAREEREATSDATPAAEGADRVAEKPVDAGDHDQFAYNGHGSLLDTVLSMVPTEAPADQQPLETFLNTRIDSPEQAAEAFVQWCELTRTDPRGLSALDRSHLLSCAIGEIDRLLNDQVNAILHAPQFQRLEASWAGLRSLVEQVAPEARASTKIRVLNLSWSDLRRDLQRANEFDQSQLFRKVYEEEFGTPNGEPFGALIGDYQITNSTEDLEMLQQIAGVAAAAFAPFIAAADASLLDLNRFADLDRPHDLASRFSQAQFTQWRSLRESEDARFVGLTMPRVLMRRPYEQDARFPVGHVPQVRVDGFCFREETADVDARRYLWGNASYAFGGVLLRAFQQTGWLADIRGVRRDELSGGVVDGSWLSDNRPSHERPAEGLFTETVITDELEHELTELGFIPLCHCQDTGDAAFYSVPSIQLPKRYDDDEATANAKISAMLQHIFCASRFAHYLKLMIRDKVGSYTSAEDIQTALNRWLSKYVRNDDEAGMEAKARYPLRRGEVYVQPSPSDPSKYFCDILLKPHYQLDALAATVRLTTDMTSK